MTNEEILEKISCLEPSLLSAIREVFDRERVFAESAEKMLQAVKARGNDLAFARRMQDMKDTREYHENKAWADNR